MSQSNAPWSRPTPPPQDRPDRRRDPGAPGPLQPSPRQGTLTADGAPAPAPVPAGGPLAGADTRTYRYHRLPHADRNHRWWMPLVEGLVLTAVFLVLSIGFGIALAFAAPEAVTGDLLAMDQLDPMVFFILFGSVALLLPSTLLARLVLGPRPLGLIFSVAGRIRWKWLFLCFGVAAAVYVVVNAVGIGLDLVVGGDVPELSLAPGFGWLVLIWLVIVPLQCTAEELVFRGYLAQTIGSWLKHPAWAILLPVPLFVLGHDYDVWGLTSVGIMAVTMGVITWRTGGLEAGIALHTVNNMIVTVMGMVGLADMNDTSGSVSEIVYEVILNGAYLFIVFRLVRRRPSVAVTRTVILPPPPAPPRMPALASRPPAIAADGSGLAAYVLNPITQTYMTLPPQYGPYAVRDAQGRFVGILDTRTAESGGPQDHSGARPGHEQPPVDGDHVTAGDRAEWSTGRRDAPYGDGTGPRGGSDRSS